MSRALVGVVVAFVVAGAACGSDGEESSGASSSTSTTRAGVPVREETARVYFVRAEKVATGGAAVDERNPARGALRALLGGPDSFEAGLGMTTAIPAGTRLLGLSTRDGIATVDLSSEFGTGGGSLSMQLRVAQVVFTLTQYDEVTSVRFRLDGTSVDTIGGEGVMVDGVGRADFTNVTPFVLIESPVPNERVTSPLTVSGTSNTFEATVNYTVTDPDGVILDEGHTNATAGTGTWGTFAFTTSFVTERAGLGTVMAFEVSPKDGAPVNVYEVPVRIG